MQLIIKDSNPFSWNSVIAARMEKKVKLMPSAEVLLTNPTANFLGKYLGLDNAREWNQNYDKIFHILEWAKKKANGSDDPKKLIRIINEKLESCPTMSLRRIDDLLINIKLEQRFGSKEPAKLTKEVAKVAEEKSKEEEIKEEPTEEKQDLNTKSEEVEN